MKENTRRVWSIVSPIDQAIIESLINLKQEHLFDAFPKVLASHDLDRFFTQVNIFSFSFYKKDLNFFKDSSIE